jgi:hypothetical protein
LVERSFGKEVKFGWWIRLEGGDVMVLFAVSVIAGILNWFVIVHGI